jgi:hypothetical protein
MLNDKLFFKKSKINLKIINDESKKSTLTFLMYSNIIAY